ncbi:MAG TPA: MFS transporter [Gemmatimonadales bacterium]|nr:MFS transporter [Gemmatimonadales bacterium]
MSPAGAQRRTLSVLFVSQVVGGTGSALGGAVAALLAAELGGVGISGLAQSAAVVGAALFAVPATAIVHRRGRRPSLAACYMTAATGAILIVTAAMQHALPVLFAGTFLLGGSTAASYQARYAAVDLSPEALRGRHLSLVVWATTVGAVIGPSLAGPAGTLLAGHGVPTLAGPFLFASLLFLLSALLLVALLRPDPAVLARRLRAEAEPHVDPPRGAGLRDAARIVGSDRAAQLGVITMALGHVVMVGVMTMTPVHIRSAGHDATRTLDIVGLVLSAHVAGMFALAPIFGWLTDRLGRRAVIALGTALLLTACAVAGTAGQSPERLAGGLLILGMGWSATLVSGSTLLSDAIPTGQRASAQGFADLVMGLAGASAGALSGVIVGAWGYPALTLLAALAAAGLIAILAAGR